MAKKPAPTVVCYWPIPDPGENGFDYFPLRRSILDEKGKMVSQFKLEPGVPILLNEDERAALSRDLDINKQPNIRQLTITDRQRADILQSMADRESKAEIARLRDAVERLTATLHGTGMFSAAAIDSLVRDAETVTN